jgi:ferredoxin
VTFTPYHPVSWVIGYHKMVEHLVKFNTCPDPIRVATGTLLSEAAHTAGIDIAQPCGGQGRCGRCALQIMSGSVRRRSTVRLSPDDIAQGYALACQSVIESDIEVTVPPQERIERLLTSDRTIGEVHVPTGYNAELDQTMRRYLLRLTPPDMSDQTDDWGRLQTDKVHWGCCRELVKCCARETGP